MGQTNFGSTPHSYFWCRHSDVKNAYTRLHLPHTCFFFDFLDLSYSSGGCRSYGCRPLLHSNALCRSSEAFRANVRLQSLHRYLRGPVPPTIIPSSIEDIERRRLVYIAIRDVDGKVGIVQLAGLYVAPANQEKKR